MGHDRTISLEELIRNIGSETAMESKTFTGKDQYDVDQLIWNWRQNNPSIKALKTHSPVALEQRMTAPTPNHGPIMPPQDMVSVTVDYENLN
jgi:hypothetical protein